MTHLGFVAGSGIAHVGEQKYSVSYRIDVFEGLGGLKSGSGSLEGEPVHLIEIIKARGSDLELETGHKVRIVVRHVEGGNAEFLVSGPVPGFT